MAYEGGTINISDAHDNLTPTGTIKADGGTINITHNDISILSHNLVEAIDGGTINVTSVNNRSGGGNAGMQKADDGTYISSGGFNNLSGGLMEAVHCGTFEETGSGSNASGATIEALSGGKLDLTVDYTGGVTTGISNAGDIKADDATLCINIDVTGDNNHGGLGNTGTIESDCGGTLNINVDVNGNNNGNGITNSGTMVADGGALNITFDVTGTGDGGALQNTGTIKAIDGGTLSLNTTTIDNTSGTISAAGPKSAVELFNATINGGTLETSDCGIIETPSGTSTLNGVTIDDGSILQTDDCTFIDLENTTTLNGTVTFEGGGTFMLDDPPDAASIVGGSNGGTLDIAAGATLTGSGDIGNGEITALALSNGGTVDADGVGAEIIIETGNYTITNTGLLEATHGATLEIESDVNNDCGTIGALGAGSTVQLVGAINIAGGTLTTGNRSSASDGVIEIVAVAKTETILDGSVHAVTIDGYVQVDAGASLALDGTIDNEGTINLVSDCGPSTNLVIQANVTLQGGGQVTLTDGGESAIVTNGSAVTLTNVDNTISGAGTIGDRTYLTLVNQHDGTVDANICGATLAIDTSNTVTNAGTLEATNGGTLQIADVVNNSNVIAAYAGSTVYISMGLAIPTAAK